MIPYRYAGFLFANHTTFPKFVTERERGYYCDRDLSKRISDEIDVNGRVINLIGLSILGAKAQYLIVLARLKVAP